MHRYCILIFLLFFCNTFRCSQNNYPVLSANVPPARGFTVKQVLTTSDDNDTIFVCYSGYKIIKRWEKDGGNYRRKPIYSHKTNYFAEIDPQEKIEHAITPCKPVDNDTPVIDIARHNDYYLIAHNTHVYACTKKSNLITNSLVANESIEYNAQIKKIFGYQDNKVIAVSENGKIFITPLQHKNTHNEPIVAQSSYDLQDTSPLYTVIYDNNRLLFGLLGKVIIVSLNDYSRQTITLRPNLPVHTIDINNHYLLACDVNQFRFIQFCDLQKKSINLHHNRYDGNCCQVHKINKNERTKETTQQYSLSGTLEEIHKQLQKKKQKKSTADPLHHDESAAATDPLIPDNCNKQTVYLIPLSHVHNTQDEKNIEQYAHQYVVEKYVISFVALSNNHLIIGKRNYGVSAINLETANFNNSLELLQKQDKSEALYLEDRRAIQCHKANEKIAIFKLTGWCFKGCQSYCHCPEKFNAQNIKKIFFLETETAQPQFLSPSFRQQLSRFLCFMQRKIYVVSYAIPYVLSPFIPLGTVRLLDYYFSFPWYLTWTLYPLGTIMSVGTYGYILSNLM